MENNAFFAVVLFLSSRGTGIVWFGLDARVLRKMTLHFGDVRMMASSCKLNISRYVTSTEQTLNAVLGSCYGPFLLNKQVLQAVLLLTCSPMVVDQVTQRITSSHMSEEIRVQCV